MATILAISSQVVRGTIGNSVAAFALQRLGHTVWQIPTIILSNHPGHGSAAGQATEAQSIIALWNGLKTHGWETELDAILTGYMPTAGAANATARIVQEAKTANPSLMVLCDPVIGDEPKGRYVPREAAEAIRDQLLTIADVATPNHYELKWLTGRDRLPTPKAVSFAASELSSPSVITTSVPGATPHQIANVLTTSATKAYCTAQRLSQAPKGTGDLFSAIFMAHLVNGADMEHAMACASSATDVVLAASEGADILNVTGVQDAWSTSAPAELETIT